MDEGIDDADDVAECPNCAARNGVDAAYCRGCGTERPESVETETERRVVVKEGVCFREHCNSQVSPADRTCPACGYALRAETAVA